MNEYSQPLDFIEGFFIGNLAKIITVSDDGVTIHARFQSGSIIRLTSSETTSFKPDDVIILSDERIERVPSKLWTENKFIGTVLKILEDELLVECNLNLRLIPLPVHTKVSKGNMISFMETGEFCSIVSEIPINMRDSMLGSVESGESYKVITDTPPTFADFGGYKTVVARAQELIETQMEQKERLKVIGARPVKGVIFSGPPGTGKTLLAHIIAAEAKAAFYVISGPTVVSKWVGDSETILRKIFSAAGEEDKAIIFFDEIDSIAEHRKGDTHEASKRLVAQLLTLLDGFDRAKGNIVVIAATNRIGDVDEALLRPGRFDWEVEFGVPSVSDRMEILQVHMNKVKTTGAIPLKEIAEDTEGWSPARLSSLWTEAALVAARDKRESIYDEDFVEAFERVKARPDRRVI